MRTIAKFNICLSYLLLGPFYERFVNYVFVYACLLQVSHGPDLSPSLVFNCCAFVVVSQTSLA